MQMEARQYREMTLTPITEGLTQTKLIDCEKYVEGYAAKYDPYVLWEEDDGPIYEQFLREAFDGTDMSDIIFQLNHSGRVYARTGNGSLVVQLDDTGILTGADLGRTASAESIYDDINAGMLTKMSWGFYTGSYGKDYYYDAKTRTIVHRHVPRIFDVSVVALPANEDTSINARSFCDDVAERMREERKKYLDSLKSKTITKIKITEVEK